ncbi:inner membrane-spanning protein YciB [Phenylobacterium montanum]|uniref:Septation protein IspZ n=1 Tax=Phenylobacterium montanum TaxID=2823693 RepID=A0A975IWE8_9CAUL|nr:septation protein IspZ [Caulobacter sp. S6]QUD90002.1 septation protein IspZ [Caulobacter sp. S6]
MTAATDTLASAAEAEGPRTNSLIHAGKWLAADMFSTLLFVGLFAITHNVYAATGIAIAAGVAQIAWLRARGAAIDLMQWLSLGLVVVFGGASLMTRDPRFVMVKPTLIYAAVGAVMLKPGWMLRYIPPVAVRWGADVVNVFGYVWAGLMFATGAANLALVLHGDPKLWAWFVGVVPIASKLGLFAVQYVTMRVIIRGRIQAAGAPA